MENIMLLRGAFKHLSYFFVGGRKAPHQVNTTYSITLRASCASIVLGSNVGSILSVPVHRLSEKWHDDISRSWIPQTTYTTTFLSFLLGTNPWKSKSNALP